MVAVVIVKERGGDSGFSAAVLIGLGAVAAAIITAIAAQFRLKATLKEERKRLGDQLVHDRRMRDLDDRRRRLDSANETGQAIAQTLVDAAAHLSAEEPDEDQIEAMFDASTDQIIEMTHHVQQSWGRLGIDADLPDALKKWRQSLDELHCIIEDAFVDDRSPDDEIWQQQREEVAAAQRTFIDKFHTIAGSQIT